MVRGRVEKITFFTNYFLKIFNFCNFFSDSGKRVEFSNYGKNEPRENTEIGGECLRIQNIGKICKTKKTVHKM